jgi:hypothetical protein
VTAVWLAVRSRLRSGWRSALALVLLVGLGGGIAMAALGGARRTTTALDRFLRYTTMNSAVASITPPTGNQAYRGVPLDEAGRRRLEVQALAGIRALPEVAWAGRTMPVIMATERPGRPGWHVTLGYVPLDGSTEATYGRPIVVSGRLPDADQTDEVAVNEELAARADLRLGSRLPVGVYGSDQFARVGNGAPLVPDGLHRSLRVVGVVRYPPDVLPVVLERDDLASDHSILWLTPAFGTAMGADVANYGVGVMMRVRSGSIDLTRLQHDVAGVVGSDQVDVRRDVLMGFNVAAVTGIGKATDVESLSLVGFSALTALATGLLLWQALRRQLALEGSESPTLAALGMTERELVWTTTISAVWVGAAGAVVAAATALALSPLLPIGVARRMEVDLGPQVDRPVLVGGVVVLFVLVAAAGALTGWRQARAGRSADRDHAASGRDRLSGLGRLLGSAALPTPAATGIRMALVRGRGRAGIPVATLLTGAAVGVAAVTASAVFSASLSRLVHQPERYGATADAVVGNYAEMASAADGARRLAGDPDVEAYVGLATDGVTVNGRETTLMRRFAGRGVLPIAMIDGVPPTGDDEVALGLKTMRALGTTLGDTVRSTCPARRSRGS